MKLYCKIKRDGKWSWFGGDSSWKISLAQELCECRVCSPTKPNVVSQEEVEPCGCMPPKVYCMDHQPEEEE